MHCKVCIQINIGGTLQVWWQSSYLVAGAYNIRSNEDELRLYPSNQKLDDNFCTLIKQPAQVLLVDIFNVLLTVLTADCHITVYKLSKDDKSERGLVSVTRIQQVDISALAVHPACVVSIALTCLRTESPTLRPNSVIRVEDEPPPSAESLIFNISGKVLMIQRDKHPDNDANINPTKLFSSTQMTPIVLASCCECLWVASSSRFSTTPHLSHALWLHCGAQGTRAWLPLFPNRSVASHTFLARRIMLPVTPSIYPLSVLFEEGMLVGAETDCSPPNQLCNHPIATICRSTSLYLQDILRQMLRRNLGYHAWQLASTCSNLPHFGHVLELLLHQVLEEEATSKEPLPDSLLPRVLEFIKEFPDYHLSTIVQCARKSELPLWRYLFSMAGSPSDLFNQALAAGKLNIAASYLLILQNLESSGISLSHATNLLNCTLAAGQWDLCQDIIRFLRAIDPSDMESPKASVSSSCQGNSPDVESTRVGYIHPLSSLVTPSPDTEDLTMILPNTKALRGRTFSTTSNNKIAPDNVLNKSGASDPDGKKGPPDSKLIRGESIDGRNFVDILLERHAVKLMLSYRLRRLGEMSARLDVPLVSMVMRHKDDAARILCFSEALKQVHSDFQYPYPRLSPANVNEKITPDQFSEASYIYTRNNKNGDSGYMSVGTAETGTPIVTRSTDQMLLPHAPNRTMTATTSECPSEDVGSIVSCRDWPDDTTREILARAPSLTAHSAPPPHTEVQLRYLLQVFSEAECLDWCSLLSIILCDGLAFIRVVNAAKNCPVAAIMRLRDGLLSLSQFTNTQCVGYANFMSSTVAPQLRMLDSHVRIKLEEKARFVPLGASARQGSVGAEPSSRKDSDTVNSSSRTDEGSVASGKSGKSETPRRVSDGDVRKVSNERINFKDCKDSQVSIEESVEKLETTVNKLHVHAVDEYSTSCILM